MPRELSQFDRIRMLHMLEAARDAVLFVKGGSRQTLDDSPMVRRAVLHCIQEIGEAASRVSLSGRACVEALPWEQIVGMRHRLVHIYFDVDLDLVWEVLARDLPQLIEVLGGALADGSSCA